MDGYVGCSGMITCGCVLSVEEQYGVSWCMVRWFLKNDIVLGVCFHCCTVDDHMHR
jgi:hypothetical protein